MSSAAISMAHQSPKVDAVKPRGEPQRHSGDPAGEENIAGFEELLEAGADTVDIAVPEIAQQAVGAADISRLTKGVNLNWAMGTTVPNVVYHAAFTAAPAADLSPLLVAPPVTMALPAAEGEAALPPDHMADVPSLEALLDQPLQTVSEPTLPVAAPILAAAGQESPSAKAEIVALVPRAPSEPHPLAFGQRAHVAEGAATSGSNVAATAVSWSVTRRETHFAPVALSPRERSSAALAVAAAAKLGAEAAAPTAPGHGSMVPVTGGTPSTVPVRGDAPVFEVPAIVGGQSGEAEQDGGAALPSPAQQVFGRIASVLQEAGEAAPQPAFSQFVPGRELAAPQPLRALELSLQPEGMGTVTVKLAIRNDTVWVQLDLSRAEAAQLIDRDREVLSSLMKSAGYQVDELSVRHVESDRAAIPLTQAAADPLNAVRDGGNQSTLPDPSSGGQSAHGQRNPERSAHGGAPGTRDESIRSDNPPASRMAAGGGVYI